MNKHKHTKKRFMEAAARATLLAADGADICRQLLKERAEMDAIVDRLIAYFDKFDQVDPLPFSEAVGEIVNHRTKRLKA